MAKVAELPLSAAKLRLETVMTGIEASSNEKGRICVRTANNADEYFDDVVITTPLGWLKMNKQAIRPLTPRILQAIDSISFGRLEKVISQRPDFV
jgi:hypothetical protein